MKQYAFLVLLVSVSVNYAHNSVSFNSQNTKNPTFSPTSKQDRWKQTYSLKNMPLKACKAMATALDELYHLQPSEREQKSDSLFNSFYNYIKPRNLPSECFNAVLKVYENACLESAKAQTPEQKDHSFKKTIEPYYDMVMSKINAQRENKEKPVKFAFGDHEKKPLPAHLYDVPKTAVTHQFKIDGQKRLHETPPFFVFESISITISWQNSSLRRSL